MSKKIVMTGGGTAGHVTPNIALIPSLLEEGYEIYYIGSYSGIERKLMADYDVKYYGISSGKFRRYFDPKNFSDPFRVLNGFFQSIRILGKIKPDVIFSKGGYVSVPVVRAASLRRIPCIIHESDMTPGLANRLCIKYARKICCNFPETLNSLPAEKAVLTGSPIRRELSTGDKQKGLDLCGFDGSKPVILVIGGSLGAQAVNECVREAMPELIKKYDIIHLCGAGKMDNLLLTKPGYKQFEYVKDELKDLYAACDIVISRAGANAICELLSLKKPNILIPLPAKSSRGDQILNAKSFEKQGFSIVIEEEDLDSEVLNEKADELYEKRQTYIDNMHKCKQRDAIGTIISLINEAAKRS